MSSGVETPVDRQARRVSTPLDMTTNNFPMIITAAQTVPKQSIDENIADHCRLALLAASHKAELIIFPELSITGYQGPEARAMAFMQEDERLKPLKEIAQKHAITIVAGAPILIDDTLYLGSFIIEPKAGNKIYTKQYLHTGEENYFQPCFDYDPQIRLHNEQVAFAICADITNPMHPAAAANKSATLYLPSIFYTPAGIEAGHNALANYASQHNMHVLMANYGGPSCGYEAAGRSACWDKQGKLAGVGSHTGEGLLIATKTGDTWQCSFIATAS